jgi:hypothetical protein
MYDYYTIDRVPILIFILLVVATDHKKYTSEDGKIETQNNKVCAEHQEKVNKIFSSHSPATGTETLLKATKTLEKNAHGQS